VIDLTKTHVSKEIARGIACKLLGVDMSISDKDLSKTYRKTVLLIHPDRAKIKSSEEAFKVLTAAYDQANS